jgi:5-methylcytosine-specific restriction protein B
MSQTPDQVTPHEEQHRSWIFQANPDIFDLVEALKHLDAFRWSVRRYKTEIRKGDIAYLWLSGPNGGLMARGIVTTDPEIMDEPPQPPIVPHLTKPRLSFVWWSRSRNSTTIR